MSPPPDPALAGNVATIRSGGYSPSEAGAWLAAIVENSDDAILSKTLDGIIQTWNPGATQLFGYSAAEAIGQSITIIIPEERLPEEATIIGKIRRGERLHHFETVRRRKDGTMVDISLTVSPVRDSEGRIIGASKIARDITELRASAERQRLILREMNHRIKNLFALTAGLIALSARDASSVEHLTTDITQRLESLARAHELTLPDLAADQPDPVTSIRTLLDAILLPFQVATAARILIAGEDVSIGRRALTPLALLFHELATNAAKYGALSHAGDHLGVDIKVENGRLAVRWVERLASGPSAVPGREGFGSQLEKALIRSLHGTIERDWRDTLAIEIRVPVEQLAD